MIEVIDPALVPDVLKAAPATPASEFVRELATLPLGTVVKVEAYRALFQPATRTIKGETKYRTLSNGATVFVPRLTLTQEFSRSNCPVRLRVVEADGVLYGTVVPPQAKKPKSPSEPAETTPAE